MRFSTVVACETGTRLVQVFVLSLFGLGVTACATEPPADTPSGASETQQLKTSTLASATQSVAEAEAAIRQAASVSGVWRDTGKILDGAKKALAAGSYDDAVTLANKARRQAELGYQQALAEKARLAVPEPTPAAVSVPVPVTRLTSYRVARGDTLKTIAARPEVYGDADMWPLLLKANRGTIKDADLIYPGLKLVIDRKSDRAEIDAAIRHSRQRGGWTLGGIETTDLDYLGR